MTAPDWQGEGGATPGEWKALLAPMLKIAASAEDLRCYAVIGISADDRVELRTNMPDGPLRAVLQMVTPGKQAANARTPQLKPALDADTDQALAWTREARKKLSPGDPEDALYLGASTRLAETLRLEFPGVPLGRALMSAAASMGAVEEHLTAHGLNIADGLISVLSLAAEQLDREEAERRG